MPPKFLFKHRGLGGAESEFNRLTLSCRGWSQLMIPLNSYTLKDPSLISAIKTSCPMEREELLLLELADGADQSSSTHLHPKSSKVGTGSPQRARRSHPATEA